LNLRLLLVSLSWVIFCLWLLGGVLTLLSLARHKSLGPSTNESTRVVPRVSILVPARNEADRILSASLSSILAQDYADFEVVAVNDRSTDSTLAWMFTLAVLPPALALGSANELWPRLLLTNALTWALFISLLALVNRRFGVHARYALTAPLGWLLSCAVLVASAYGVLTGCGLTWKGRRFYERTGVRPPRARD
jgi:hypothetical protein